jgi:hypothetical protein
MVENSNSLSDVKIYRGFACPQVELDHAFLEFLVIEHAREMLRQHLASNEIRVHGQVATLSALVQTFCPFDAVWSLAFGEFLASVWAGRSTDVRHSIASLLLRLHEYGFEGDWEIDSLGPGPYRFDRWLIPPTSSLRVYASNERVQVQFKQETGEWCAVTFERAADTWLCAEATELPVIEHRGIRWHILTAECFSSSVVAERLLKDQAYSALDDDYPAQSALLETIVKAAMDVVGTGAPMYLPWISCLVRNLVPLRANRHTQNSTTAFLAPGVIALSQEHPVLMAETLVHEATHQYFYVLSRLGPVEDGTDTNLYFSPFKNTGRPLRYIVLTYHAFGNVVLFYRGLRAQGLTAYELGRDVYLQELEGKLAILENTLRSCRTLTPIGKALWEPIFDQLQK